MVSELLEQGKVNSCRSVSIDLSGGSRAAPGLNTEPDLWLSPTTGSGLKTTGFAFAMASQPAASTSLAGGFTVTIWTLMNSIWTSWQALTGVAVDQRFVTFDCDATGVFFQIANVNVGQARQLVLCEEL